jgi:hypothetical protein
LQLKQRAGLSFVAAVVALMRRQIEIIFRFHASFVYTGATLRACAADAALARCGNRGIGPRRAWFVRAPFVGLISAAAQPACYVNFLVTT